MTETIEPILDAMGKLETLHKRLLDLAYRKTEALKVGDAPALDAILQGERQYAAAIDQLEEQRQLAVAAYLRARGIALPEPATVLQVAEASGTPQDKARLLAARQALLRAVGDVKRQNDLNQKLTFQSLQLVNVTLDALRPRPDAINYSKAEAGGAPSAGADALFDSQA